MASQEAPGCTHHRRLPGPTIGEVAPPGQSASRSTVNTVGRSLALARSYSVARTFGQVDPGSGHFGTVGVVRATFDFSHPCGGKEERSLGVHRIPDVMGLMFISSVVPLPAASRSRLLPLPLVAENASKPNWLMARPSPIQFAHSLLISPMSEIAADRHISVSMADTAEGLMSRHLLVGTMSLMDWVGWLIGLAGLAATLYALKRPTRRLAWELIRNDVLFAPTGTDSGYPRRVVIRIMNKGREPIRREDYESAVTFICRSLAVSATVGPRSDKNLRPAAVLRDGRLSYEPMLLNPGDWFDLEAMYDDVMGGGPLYFSVYEGRVAGVTEIEDWAKRTARRDRLQKIAGIVGGGLMVTAGVAILTTGSFSFTDLTVIVAAVSLGFVGVAIVLLVTGILRPGRLPSWWSQRQR